MNDDRQIDPVTEDFVSAPGGAFAGCDAVDNMVAVSFKIKRGSWEGDPLLGHQFDQLANAPNTLASQQRLADLCVDAVQWLIDAKLITNVTPTVQPISDNPVAVAYEVDYMNVGSGQNQKAGPFMVAVGVGS